MKRGIGENQKSNSAGIKNLLFVALVVAMIIGCATTKPKITTDKAISKNDTVRIANDSLEYEVIIIDPGFNVWLSSVARPRNFYSLTLMETKNYMWVSEYNRRVLDPFRYDPNLYEMRIDYQSNIKYGYEVNYLIYNYFLYFQKKYKQKL